MNLCECQQGATCREFHTTYLSYTKLLKIPYKITFKLFVIGVYENINESPAYTWVLSPRYHILYIYANMKSEKKYKIENISGSKHFK